MPPRKPLIMSDFATTGGRMTTRLSNKDRVVGLPDMPAPRATKEEAAAKRAKDHQINIDKITTNLEALKTVAAIEDAQMLTDLEKDENADHPVATGKRRVFRRIASTTGERCGWAAR